MSGWSVCWAPTAPIRKPPPNPVSVIPERRRRRAEINIIPLVDVLVTLIFFFLVSTQFKNIHTLNITFPKIETAGENVFLEQIEIALTEDGEFYYNGRPVTRERLEEGIRIVANLEHRTPVILMADEESRLRDITFVMDLLRKNGLENVRLQGR